ncbi:Cof-type HAD-IIB family hydrolase [Enterococcus mediterraneensis]|uniref:Cof-type HAD-IIB family hydrolase n=1 Tax=Enterococcus mediterraneensis TaxID=2364791 RepID=UPI000F062C70|nr:HAD family hydrolase [Enterococcus mediterraneensis]
MKLIGIDLDGTLLNSEQKISEKNVNALKELSQDFLPFICSGREVEDIKMILKKSNFTLPVVGLNGALGYDGDKLIFEFAFDPQSVREANRIISRFPTKVYTNRGSYESQNYKDEMQKVFREIGSEFSIEELNYELDYEKTIRSTAYESIEEVISQEDIKIYKLFIFIPNRQVKKEIYTRLGEVANISVTESAAVNLEIVPNNVSKGFVFDHMRKIYNLNDPLKIAIGDSLNDLEMFKSADLSFAMANGHKTIKEIADHITVTNDEDGVSEALSKICALSL